MGRLDILIIFVAMATECSASTCGGQITDPSGSFTSPNYPNNYPNNQNCWWTVGQPGDFIDLVFDGHTERCCDVINIISMNGQYLEQYKGNIHNRHFVNNDQVQVQFYSDYSVTDDGFICDYTIDHVIPITQTPGCDFKATSGSGNFTSPNYPNDYPNDTICQLQLLPDPGYSVSFVFTDFALEMGWDTVQIFYSGEVQDALTGTQGDNLMYQTSGNITGVFMTDSAITERGFSADYMFYPTPGSTPAPPACGDDFTLGSGTFSSPNYPDYYPNNVYCNWTLGDIGDVITLDFNVQTEACCDIISIYDQGNGHLLQTYSGNMGPRTFFSIDGVYVVFTTDVSVTSLGFTCDYVISDSLPQTLTPDCGSTITSGAGNFTSPNYPSDYPTNENCVWTLRPQTGEFYLLFQDFQLDLTDFVQIYESGSLVSTLTGTQGQDILVKNKEIVIIFYSDQSSTARGFLALYQPAS